MVFFIFHKAWESVLEYNYQDTYARALPSGDALNYVEETFMSFSCVFWVEGKDSEVVLSPLWLPFANGWRQFEAVSSKTQSLAEQPTCWCRTRARESGLDIFLVLKSCCICFCSKIRGENCGSPIVLWQLYGQFGEYWLFVLRDTIKCPEFPPYWMEPGESLTAVLSALE